MFCIVESPARVEKISILRLFDLFIFFRLLLFVFTDYLYPQYRRNSIIAQRVIDKAAVACNGNQCSYVMD